MTDYLRRAGVSVLDLTPTLIEDVRREGIKNYFTHGHYSARGNIVVSEAILENLSDLMIRGNTPLRAPLASARQAEGLRWLNRR